MTSIRATFARSSATPWMALATALLIQWQFGAAHQTTAQLQTSPTPAPSATMFELIALGETRAAATAAVLYPQSFDAQNGQSVSLRSLDIGAIAQWLKLAGDLNPNGQYPSFLASRIYAEMAAPNEARHLLYWIRDQFERAPQVHWPALAHAVHLARYRLEDMPLARELASTLRLADPQASIPPWARELEIFMLRESDELTAAQALLGGLIESGQVKDERALAVMIADLQDIERRLKQDRRPTDRTPNADITPEAQLNSLSDLVID